MNPQVSFVANISLQSLLHPLSYTKVLMQLNYEPYEPRAGKTMFGSPVMISGNFVDYIKDMREQDGFFGPYRGLTYKIAASFVATMGATRTLQCIKKTSAGRVETISHEGGSVEVGVIERGEEDEEYKASEEHPIKMEEIQRALVETRDETCAKVAGVILSHPFQVVATRMMAEFIGKETCYSGGYVSGVCEVYRNEGVRGFLAGLVPRLLCEVSCIWLTNTITFFLQRLLIEDRDLRKLCKPVVSIFVSSFMYPLQVVSTVMMVNESGLVAAGSDPKYATWLNCYWDLSKRKELKRGARMFWRYQPIRI